jgi:hypothetical protein
VPREDAVAAGYPSGTVNLESFLGVSGEVEARCEALQGAMVAWLAGYRRQRALFDGSIRSVLDLYETHPASPFHSLKPGSRHPYQIYLKKLRAYIGGRAVEAVIGLDVMDWYKVWSNADEAGRPRSVAAGRMAVTVLKSALSFACICGFEECRRLKTVLSDDLTFAVPRPRSMVATADDVVKARDAAHAIGSPSRALAYALQFETVLRQWDVIGQWYPLAEPFPSAVIRGDRKWVGLSWSHIDDDLVLRYRPTKTESTSGADVVIDLKLCPMVLEEMAHVPPEGRSGPVIVSETTGLPYTADQYQHGWTRVRKVAGLPKELWARDLRASGITEARAGTRPAALEDAAKVAGHTTKRTTAQVYDREHLEAARRFSTARIANRTGTS